MLIESRRDVFVMIISVALAIIITGAIVFNIIPKPQNDAEVEISYSTHVVQDISFVKGSWLDMNAVHVITDDGTFVITEHKTSYFLTEEQTHLKLEASRGLSRVHYTGNLYIAKDDFLTLSKEYADIFNQTMQVNDTIEE